MDCSLAVLFITLNEEYHIGAAIDNVKDIASEIWVVDSGSKDKTVEIAESKGAKVVYHKFETFGAQWNFALSLPLKSAWTMKMDPDERLRDELKKEIVSSIQEAKGTAGFEFDRILWFMGKPMRGWKDRVVRVWKTGACRFTDVIVNEHPLINGAVGFLHGKMDHLDSRDLHHWISKQNAYTTQVACARLLDSGFSAQPRLFGSRLERRMWVKRLYRALPFHHALRFIYIYVSKRLWSEGWTGWHCALLRVWAARLIDAKILEMRNTGMDEIVKRQDSQRRSPSAVECCNVVAAAPAQS